MLLAARALIRLLGWLPLAWLHGLARWPGALLYRLPWKKHAVIQDNLALCFPELDRAARRDLHRAYLTELFRLILEAGALWHWSRKRIEAHIELTAGENILAAEAAETRGTLVVSGHLGNWELLNLYLSTRVDLATLYRAPSRPALDRFISQPRERFGARMVPGDASALRSMLGQLRSGKAVAMAADIQPKRGDGQFVPFFGIDTLTMTLVHKLARRTGCRVVLALALRRPQGAGWTVSVVEAGDWIQDPDPMVALGGLNEWLEAAIRQAPEQYLWLYKRFSKRPEGQANRYPRLKGEIDRSSSRQPCPDG